MDDPLLLGAYLLFYWPISYAQARVVLGELVARPRCVLDLGSGPGPFAFAALDAGASGFVGKDAPAEEVVAAARHAAANPRAFTASDLAAAMQRRMSAPAGPRLSPREKEVLDLLVDGLAIAQIARRLFISESTAKTHVANIYEKLGAGNRAQAVMAAVRLGLVKDEDRKET